MASIVGLWMVRKNKHLPKELYLEILSYLLPKHLLATIHIRNYNKVVKSIPGFEVSSSNPRRIFSSATKSFQTVRYIYKLKRKWKKTRPNNPANSMDRNTSIVYVPACISRSRSRTAGASTTTHHAKQYDIYNIQQFITIRQDKINKAFLEKAKYGW